MTAIQKGWRSVNGVRQRFRLALLVTLVVLPFVVFGARRAIEGMRITPEKWVSESHPERQQFESFRRDFEGNDVVLISWEGCTWRDPRLQQFEQAVIVPADHELADRHRRDYDRVVTGESLLRQLTAAPLGLSHDEALERLHGTLIGADGETSCALVVLTWEGNERRGESIRHLKEIAADVTGNSVDSLYVAGPPHDGVAIDRESRLGVNVFSTLCTLTATMICGLSLRTWRITGVIIGIACLGQGLSLALVAYLGLTLDAILIVMPPLIFVLTVSAGIHITNYCAEASGAGAGDLAVVHGLRAGMKPCLLATGTTAVGLTSLAVSQVSPVLIFGVLSAISLLLTTGLLLTILPGALLRHPVPRRSTRAGSTRVLRTSWTVFPIVRTTIVAGSIAAMLISAAGLPRLSTSVDVLALFSPDSRIVRNYKWFESRIGASVPVEVVVAFPTDDAPAFRRRVELVDRVHRAIEQVDGVSGVVSALTFSPQLPLHDPSSSYFRSAILYRRMERHLDDYVAQHYVHESEHRQSWRLTGHVSATAGADYALIQARLRNAVTPLIAASNDSARIEVAYTGMMPLIQSVQTSILSDLFRSFLTAFALIAVAIGFVLGSIRLTLLAMLPNLFPAVIIFGCMGWLAIPADIGTVMTASVALGIAVDDTIHFLASYRRSLQTGVSGETAVHQAMQQCSRAMLQTTAICAAGMLVFCFSGFVPTFRFGLVMALSLAAALVGDLVFLPALLVSPLGRWAAGAEERQPGIGSRKVSEVAATVSAYAVLWCAIVSVPAAEAAAEIGDSASSECMRVATCVDELTSVPAEQFAEITVTAPPAELDVADMYTRFASVNGYPIVACDGVSDYAVKEAAYLIGMLMAERPDVLRAMTASGSRMCILGYNQFTTDLPEFAWLTPKDYWDARARGTGGSQTDPYCSCGEENLLGYPGDPYAAECILIHEFAHNIHLRGLVNLDPTFDDRLRAAYDSAMKHGLWKGKYASVNHHEYFAEGVQSWFDNNRENDHDHNHVNTREELLEYDSGLAAICREVFGDTQLKYTKPATRLHGHLEGYDPAAAPTFVWPERLDRARQDIRRAAEERSSAAEEKGVPPR